MKLEPSVINQIEKKVQDNAEKFTLKTNNDETLTMNNHPIDAAIALLQNKKVASGKLTATIIEPSSSNKNSQCSF